VAHGGGCGNHEEQRSEKLWLPWGGKGKGRGNQMFTPSGGGTAKRGKNGVGEEAVVKNVRDLGKAGHYKRGRAGGRLRSSEGNLASP